MRNVMLAILTILATGCDDITAPTVEDQQDADTLPVITLSPALKPVLWTNPGRLEMNTVTFFAPTDRSYPIEFDIWSDNVAVAVYTAHGLNRHEEPNCEAKCQPPSYTLDIFVRGEGFGYTKIFYRLRNDPRVIGYFTIYVSLRG